MKIKKYKSSILYGFFIKNKNIYKLNLSKRKIN